MSILPTGAHQSDRKHASLHSDWSLLHLWMQCYTLRFNFKAFVDIWRHGRVKRGVTGLEGRGGDGVIPTFKQSSIGSLGLATLAHWAIWICVNLSPGFDKLWFTEAKIISLIVIDRLVTGNKKKLLLMDSGSNRYTTGSLAVNFTPVDQGSK